MMNGEHVRVVSAKSSLVRFILSLSPSASRRACCMRICMSSALLLDAILAAWVCGRSGGGGFERRDEE